MLINVIIGIALFISSNAATNIELDDLNLSYSRNCNNIVQLRDVHICDNRSMYEKLSEKEIHLIEATVQNEVGNFSKEYKTYVTEILYNRIKSKLYPSNIEEMLFQDGQFQGINYWYDENTVIDKDIKEIVKKVFSKEKPSHNATSYYNPALSTYNACIWFEYSGNVEFIFEYTEYSYGIKYTTRFFKSAYE